MPSYSLGELATTLGARLNGGNKATIIRSLAPLADAGEGDLSFLANSKYRQHLAATQASAVLLAVDDEAACPVPALVVDNPALAFITIAQLFERKITQPIGIHSTAVIGDDCSIDETVSIGPHCVIGHDVVIARYSVILPGTVIGDAVEIGEHCLLHPNVTIYAASIIGSRVTIHSGAVIGSDGFGNLSQEGRWVKAPQLGRVRIGDDVDIGANTTIDCGALGDTIIADGVKLDNLIQIAHNVQIGANTAIAAQVGIAGSTIIGKNCMLAGKVGINGHITICDHVIVMANSSVSQSIKVSGIYSAVMPVLPHRAWLKNMACFNKLYDMYKRLLTLEKIIDNKD